MEKSTPDKRAESNEMTMQSLTEKMREAVLNEYFTASSISICYGNFSKNPDKKMERKAKLVENHLWKTLKAIDRFLGPEWTKKHYAISENSEQADIAKEAV